MNHIKHQNKHKNLLKKTNNFRFNDYAWHSNRKIITEINKQEKENHWYADNESILPDEVKELYGEPMVSIETLNQVIFDNFFKVDPEMDLKAILRSPSILFKQR